MSTSHAATLIAERLGSDLGEWVNQRRADGDSWNRIAVALYDLTGVLVTAESVRRWFTSAAA